MRLNPSRDSLDLSKLLFLASLLMAAFMYGTAVGRYNLFPFSLIQFTWGSVKQVFQERDTILGVRPTFLLERARQGGDGVTLFRKDAIPGFTLLGGFCDEALGFQLIRLDGTIVNRWPARFHEIFSGPFARQAGRPETKDQLERRRSGSALVSRRVAGIQLRGPRTAEAGPMRGGVVDRSTDDAPRCGLGRERRLLGA